MELLSDMVVQVDIGLARQVNSHKHLICTQQTQNRLNFPAKSHNIAIFDKLDLRKYYVEIDGQGYARDSLFVSYERNDCIGQYKGLNLFV